MSCSSQSEARWPPPLNRGEIQKQQYMLFNSTHFGQKQDLIPQRRPGKAVLVRVIVCLIQALALGAVNVLGAEIRWNVRGEEVAEVWSPGRGPRFHQVWPEEAAAGLASPSPPHSSLPSLWKKGITNAKSPNSILWYYGLVSFSLWGYSWLLVKINARRKWSEPQMSNSSMSTERRQVWQLS